MLGDLKFLSALREQMHWHSARQGVLAENIANADTPGYRGRDLARIDHEQRFRVQRSGGLEAARTHSSHIQAASLGGAAAGFESARAGSFEITPEGNSVVLEEQMMEMTANQLDYQTAATLYQKSIGLIRSAIGRR